MSTTRSDFIKVAISDVIAEVGSRESFYKKLASTYKGGTVTRATVSMWIKKGDVPANKAAFIAAWSNGKYQPSDICSSLCVH